MKKGFRNIASLSLGLIVALLILELFLRFYNPINQRLEKGAIRLPANMEYDISNDKITSLPKKIKHTKNSLGFRGPEPMDSVGKTSIICVGGSTTECFYLPDGTDWPAKLQDNLGNNFWVNNAGLDGHSTFGHYILLKNHLLSLKPKYIIFLIGCNDVAASQINNYEKDFISGKKRLLEQSAIFNTLSAMKRSKKARNFGMHHQSIDFVNSSRTDTTGWALWKNNSSTLPYANRVVNLAKLCIENNIKPIFCSQPSILSAKTIAGTFVGDRNMNGESAMHYMQKLNAFNKSTQEACTVYGLKFIDLANMLPAVPENYYDNFHFTQAGAEAVATIITNHIGL